MQSQDIKPSKPQDEHIVENIELNIWEALIPVFALVGMLAYNVYVFGDDAIGGSNQFILLMGGAVAAIVGVFNKVSYKQMLTEVAENVKSTTGALLILLMVGALAGTWLISGIIPAMIYYGLQILNPTIFLAACVVICAIISIATGSSWTTSATVGIALIGIGEALGISLGMTAGAVLSGAYFGDKMSPLSDTTNLAPAMAGGELFDHIKYMTITTVPTILVTLVIFIIMGFTIDTTGSADTASILESIDATLNINGWLFIVPLVVIFLIIKKTPPLAALLIGTLLGAVFALIFQPEIVAQITGAKELTFESGYKGILKAITVKTSIATDNTALNDLFSAKGMAGMLGTIWLIICAMVFGGVMDGIGALSRITSDQYLAIVVPGKMFAQAYADRNLAPENLSRTLEDSGTVTSVLIPWNTCGAYHSGVLGVSVADYFLYAIFNWLSPFMTLLFAALNIKIKQLRDIE
jgi:NhaC family Na+:H+ antiporter